MTPDWRKRPLKFRVLGSHDRQLVTGWLIAGGKAPRLEVAEGMCGSAVQEPAACFGMRRIYSTSYACACMEQSNILNCSRCTWDAMTL